MSYFGDAVRAARKRASVTLAQLAEESGVSERNISYIERGDTKDPRVSTLILLARALLVPERKFLDEAVRDLERELR